MYLKMAKDTRFGTFTPAIGTAEGLNPCVYFSIGNVFQLFVAQRIDRIHHCRPPCRVDSEDDRNGH
jgi:hypothetical protein